MFLMDFKPHKKDTKDTYHSDHSFILYAKIIFELNTF